MEDGDKKEGKEEELRGVEREREGDGEGTEGGAGKEAGVERGTEREGETEGRGEEEEKGGEAEMKEGEMREEEGVYATERRRCRGNREKDDVEEDAVAGSEELTRER